MSLSNQNSVIEEDLPLVEDDPSAEVALERKTGALGEVQSDDSETIEVRDGTTSDESMGDSTAVDADLAFAETLSVTAKLKERQTLEEQLAEFLAKGGKIEEVPAES